MSPLFSVVIPVFNRSKVIGVAIKSVLSQGCQDFEIVVVDDGSKDDTCAAVESFGDPRIRLIRQANSGGSAARNRGIDAAEGRYIAFLDSDDKFLPTHLGAMLDLLQQGPKIVAYSPIIVDRGHGRSFIKPPRALRPGEAMADYLMSDRGFVQTSGLAVPAALARQVKYRLGLPFGQDTDFAIRLQLAGCTFKMAAEPSVVWSDVFDPARVSSARKGSRVIGWLEEMRPFISRKAYLGYRGWHVAKGIAPSKPLRALYYYFVALVSGCYRPKLGIAVLLQIILPTHLYRRVADRIVHLSGRPI